MSGLRDQLQSIHDEHGKLTPALVVDAARPKNHPLHNHFEWNNSVAGEAWRRHQAHELIRSVKVVYREATETEEALTVRAFQHVRSEAEVSAYEPVEVVATDPLLTAMVLRDMEREWRQLHRRWGHFREFVELVREDIGPAAA